MGCAIAIISESIMQNHALHPLDPLTETEIGAACEIVRMQHPAQGTWRFPLVQLDEPPQEEVLRFEAGTQIMRKARLVVLDHPSGAVYMVRVDLDRRIVTAFTRNEAGPTNPVGQPPVTMQDMVTCDRVVKASPAWRAAIMRRGITEDEIPLVQVDPFSAGYFGYPAEEGRRVVRAVSYRRSRMTDNGYAHPIEGVVATVDLNAEKVIGIVDDGNIVPIPTTAFNYDPDSLPSPRTTLKPLHIEQPEGPSFSVNGWETRWQNWSFRVGFTQREGLVLHQLCWNQDGKTRPIIYRASVTEMVVPYADPTTNHYWKSAFDGGEYGLGTLANSLALGCDCLGLIRYFDIPLPTDDGTPRILRRGVCMHEEDYGTLWKHYDARSGVHQVRRSRRLVISFFATVGNYDYGFYWYLYLDGTIQLEAKLTGIIQTAAIAPDTPYPWGGMVAPGLGGPTHQHFFNVRLHMMLDGIGNSLTETEFHPRPMGKDNPYGNVFDTRTRLLCNEHDAAREADGRTGRFWKIVNPNTVNSVGAHPGYKLVVTPSPLMLADPKSTVSQRGGFATKHVWATPYDPDQRYGSGELPNQSPGGDGLPAFIRNDRPIENSNLVVWHTFGHTHICKPEDMPIMSVEYAGFMLKPVQFFSSNPTMDLPAAKDSKSVQDGLSGCCQNECKGS